MSEIARLLDQLRTEPSSVAFADVITLIDSHYQFNPCAFDNGTTRNEAGTNEGSCKVLAFAQMNRLDPQTTLHLFGDYYRQDVLQHPEGTDHANIRSFMKEGWAGVRFHGTPLSER